MSDKFAEENKDFVLKITLEGSSEDDHQTRRVKLPRIFDSTGKVSYEELVGLVFRLSFPAVNDASLSSKKKSHKVKLTYHDVDSDLIYLGSTEELIDACEQYSEKRFVRMNAKVERRRSPQRQQQQQQKRLSGDESNLIDGVSVTNPVAATASVTSPSLPPQTQTHVTGDVDSNQTDQFQNVVVSIIKMLGSASVAIHGSNSSTTSNESTPVPSRKEQEIKSAARGPKQEVTSVVKSDVNDDTQAAVNHNERAIVRGELKQPPSNDEVKSFPTVNSINNIMKSNNGVIKDNHSDKDIENSAEKDKDKNKDKKEQEKPSFIHGRHTCDVCIVTPIVGNRYHATSLPDYDICENCHNSYEGNEIQFEVVQLDRDRHLQNRWRRRSQQCMRQQNRGRHGARRCKRDFQVATHKPLTGFRLPFGAGPPRRCGDALPPQRSRTNKSMDLETKEAIRRSLEDDSINRIVKENSNRTKKQIAVKKLPVFPRMPQVLATKEDDAAPAYTEEEGSPIPLKVESRRARTEAAISIAGNEEKKPADTKLTRKSKENGNQSKIEIKPQCKEVKTKVIYEQNDEEGAGMKEEKDEDDTTQAKEEEKDTLLEKKPDPRQEEKSTESNVQNPSVEDKCKEKDDSFTSDAEGNGSVAGFLGETLDKFADGIDEMVMEIHRISSDDNENKKGEQDEGKFFESGEEKEPSIHSKQENDEVSNTDNDTFPTIYAAEERVECGATILESLKTPNGDKADAETDESSKADSTVDDWQVVNENRVDLVQNEDTEAIALATQLIGSSLFNSAMDSHNSREEDVSALTGCSISTVSSVPTNLASSITSSDICLEHSSIYQRWEPQLKQLKDLGFDEKRCVEVLEKLEAANIGVETPDEEITVAQVVNELFK